MIEKYAHREQAESRAEYIRIGRYKTPMLKRGMLSIGGQAQSNIVLL